MFAHLIIFHKLENKSSKIAENTHIFENLKNAQEYQMTIMNFKNVHKCKNLCS